MRQLHLHSVRPPAGPFPGTGYTRCGACACCGTNPAGTAARTPFHSALRSAHPASLRCRACFAARNHSCCSPASRAAAARTALPLGIGCKGRFIRLDGKLHPGPRYQRHDFSRAARRLLCLSSRGWARAHLARRTNRRRRAARNFPSRSAGRFASSSGCAGLRCTRKYSGGCRRSATRHCFPGKKARCAAFGNSGCSA